MDTLKKIKSLFVISNKKYQYKTTLLKGLKMVLYVVVPAILSYITNVWKPGWTGLTIGTILVMLENYLKNKNAKK